MDDLINTMNNLQLNDAFTLTRLLYIKDEVEYIRKMNLTAMHVDQQQQLGGEENGPVWHVVANKSQFDFEHGRSACVAIACEAAVKILCLLGDKETMPRQEIKSEMLLQSC